DVLGRSPVPEKIDQPIDGIADRHISLRGQVFAASPSWPRRGDLPRSTTCCIQSYGLGVARHPLRATSKQSGCKIGCSRENAEEREPPTPLFLDRSRLLKELIQIGIGLTSERDLALLPKRILTE